MSSVIQNMNGTIWVFASILILWVLVQSGLFLRLTLNFNKKNQLLSSAEIKQTASTGFVSVLGPAISVVVVAISLIAMVGPATTFMRCGVIGAPMWELMMAEYSAQSAGMAFGDPGFNESIFTLCIFGMTLASAPYFINTIFTLKPMDKAVANSAKAAAAGSKKESFIPTLGSAAMMGMMGYSILDYFLDLNKFVAFACAMVTAVILMKFEPKVKGLATWSMAIAMLVGMFGGQLFKTIMG